MPEGKGGLPEGWQEEEPVQRWLERIERKGVYSRQLGYFLDWIQMGPSELVENRKNQMRSDDSDTRRWLEGRVVEYVDALYARGLKRSSVVGYLRSVQSFFSSQFMPLKFLRNEIKHQEIESTKVSHVAKFVLNNVELRALVNVCRSNFDKGLLLASAHSGFSTIDLSQLIITEQLLDDIKAKRHHYIEKYREKSEELQQTFISDEALFFIDLYLKRRDYKIGEKLFVTQKNRDIDSKYMTEKFKALAVVAFGEKGREFQAKNLRDIIYNGTQLGGLTSELTESLLGWKKSGAKGSYMLNEIVMRQAYDKIFKYLSIDGATKSRAEFEGLQTALVSQEAEMRGLRVRIDSLVEKAAEAAQLKTMVEQFRDVRNYQDMKMDEMEANIAELRAEREEQNRRINATLAKVSQINEHNEEALKLLREAQELEVERKAKEGANGP